MKTIRKYLLLLLMLLTVGITFESCAGRNSQYGCPDRMSVPLMTTPSLQP